MNASFCEQLLAAAEQAAFPAEKTLDPQTGLESLDPASAAAIAQVFDLFGATGLTPDSEDYDLEINTTCTLAVEVAAHVRSLVDASGALAAVDGAAEWHPDYQAYVRALWEGDRQAIAAGANRLKVLGGIPNGSLPLEVGPLA
ncbi:hypothetical protein [Polaromonas sp.]|uniref:hypothetical protein n=1 Tax=Polaromonas sp. TaxID=1869339 RepID=UPI003567450C